MDRLLLIIEFLVRIIIVLCPLVAIEGLLKERLAAKEDRLIILLLVIIFTIFFIKLV